jgi:hypothetical protein
VRLDVILVGTAVVVASGNAATGASEAGAVLRPRTLAAARLRGTAPLIDGRLDDPAWADAEVATEFVQRRPVPGAVAALRTEARVLYDARALYVGVRALDPEPARILAPWPRRDDEITSDWIFVEIDSRHDRRTAVSLGVNPRGVQVDGTFFNDIEYDTAWDAVWQSAARVDEGGWSVEYRIPFSQLPYTAGGSASADGSTDAVWGFNVYRHTPHRGETSNWSPRLPSLAGVVSRFNELRLRVPARPARLEAAPYAATTATRVPGRNPLAESQSFSAGADIKAALGPAFRLAATVHPDFSQVEADPSEVNLTSFETFFSERRPLFVESGSLLHFDSSLPLVTRGNSFQSEQPYYSRRIGRAPHLPPPEDARYADAPEASPLLGAVTLTGRTSSGWSVGALGAVTGRATAEFVSLDGRSGSRVVEPLTQFAAARVAHDFRNGGSALGAMATLMARPGMDAPLAAVLPRSALSAGVDGRHRFARDAYELTGFLLGGRIEGRPEAVAALLDGPGHFLHRPDSAAFGESDGHLASGFAGQLRLARVGGEHWRWTVAAHAVSPRLELNDLGFQRNADWLIGFARLSYQCDRPGRLFRRWAVGSDQMAWGRSFAGERRAAVVNATASADLRNYWGGSARFDHELPALQVEALRGGPALLVPSRDTAALSVYSDTRKASQTTLEAKWFRDHGHDGRGLSLAATAALRVSDRLAVSVGPAIEHSVNPWQFVAAGAAPARSAIVARLDQTSLGLTGRFDLAFSKALTLQLYAQPFVSRGRFDRYGEVIAPRAPRPADRVAPLSPGQGPTSLGDPSFSVADLRMNLVLRWEYRPGSRVYVVWNQTRHRQRDVPDLRLPADALDAFASAPTNVLLLKLSYWLAR